MNESINQRLGWERFSDCRLGDCQRRIQHGYSSVLLLRCAHLNTLERYYINAEFAKVVAHRIIVPKHDVTRPFTCKVRHFVLVAPCRQGTHARSVIWPGGNKLRGGTLTPYMAVIIMASIGILVSNHSRHNKMYSELIRRMKFNKREINIWCPWMTDTLPRQGICLLSASNGSERVKLCFSQ